MKLFEVRTRNYKGYYVEASGYDEAVKKVERYIDFETEANGIIDYDGSIRNKEDNKAQVVEVKIVADFIIR